MRVLWTLFKVIVGLAIAIPVGLFLLMLTMGIVGTFVRLAFVALKLACVGFVVYGTYRLVRSLFAPARPPAPVPTPELRSADPYYAAAMRELDAELGHSASR